MKNHKCKNSNECNKCSHDHKDHEYSCNDRADTMPATSNGNPNVVMCAPFGNHPRAAMVEYPEGCTVDLESHMDYMEKNWDKTANLLRYANNNYGLNSAYVNTEDGKIGYCRDNPMSGRIIHAMEFSTDDTRPAVSAVVTFTENNGFRIAGATEDNEIVDLGPIVNPMFVGPKSHPQAMLIPLTNIAAVAKSEEVLHRILENYMADYTEVAENGSSDTCICNNKLP